MLLLARAFNGPALGNSGQHGLLVTCSRFNTWATPHMARSHSGTVETPLRYEYSMLSADYGGYGLSVLSRPEPSILDHGHKAFHNRFDSAWRRSQRPSVTIPALTARSISVIKLSDHMPSPEPSKAPSRRRETGCRENRRLGCDPLHLWSR